MGRDSAFMAVKDAIGGGESFFGDVKVIVENAGSIYVYDDIFVSVTYNIGYMQMDVDVMWDDDSSQVCYGILGLHKGYNSTFQDFKFTNGYLEWDDGDNHISVRFL